MSPRYTLDCDEPVYAGIDPVSKKRHYLVETVAAGPSAARDAERACGPDC